MASARESRSDQLPQFHLEPSFYFRGNAVGVANARAANGSKPSAFAAVAVPTIGALAVSEAKAQDLQEPFSSFLSFSTAVSKAMGHALSNGDSKRRFETNVMAMVEDFKYLGREIRDDQGSYGKRTLPLFEAKRIVSSLQAQQDEGSNKIPKFLTHGTRKVADFEESTIVDAFIYGCKLRIDFDTDGLLKYSSKAELERAWKEGRLKAYRHRFGLKKRHSDIVGVFHLPEIDDHVVYSMVRKVDFEDPQAAHKEMTELGVRVEFGELDVVKQKGVLSDVFRPGDGHSIRITELATGKRLGFIRLGEILRSDQSTRLLMVRIKGSYPKRVSSGYGGGDGENLSGDTTVGDVGSNGKPL